MIDKATVMSCVEFTPKQGLLFGDHLTLINVEQLNS